mmetsp:Transcript_119263/g.370560  ORF Transcript_119263/g.370560 Transcript_119263/m.370560 type:complete len:309 (+) Transcript_119263:159-1085(+)
MGQSESNADGQAPATPPEVEVSRRRQDYLHRLGIQKDKKASGFPLFGPPTESVEAPARVQQVEDNVEQQDRGFAMNVLDLKSQDDFRVNFLRKLSYSKVWVPQAQRPPKHQTVIIFDWDDTLLCTSFLNLRQDQTLPPVVERHLRDIENAGKRLLELAMRLGHTFIITNAMNGWVEYSSAKWVPELLPVLQKVRVISARTKYEPQYPGEVSKWKIQAFLEVQRQLNSEIITNLISLGDSNFEMDAVHVMGKEFAQALVKTIKFRENPSPEELLKQLELVSQKFERIVENARNLKIGLERKWVGGAQQT